MSKKEQTVKKKKDTPSGWSVALILSFMVVLFALIYLGAEYMALRQESRTEINALNAQISEKEREVSELKEQERIRQEEEKKRQEELAALEKEKEEEQQEQVVAKDPSEYKHRVYLTFDDGPSLNTQKILDILDQYDVKATFFVLGRELEAELKMLPEITKRGHSIGMHSFSHKYSDIYRSLNTFKVDYIKIRDLIYERTGVESKLYRFPGGSSNQVSNLDMQVFIDYLGEQGVTYFDWNADSGDGANGNLSITAFLMNCLEDFERKSDVVILMHDGGADNTTLQGLPVLIAALQARGDTVFLPITEDTVPIQHMKDGN